MAVIDAHSRYIVAWELGWTLTGKAMQLVLQTALDRTPRVQPEIVSDNGPEFVSQDFARVVKAQELQRIRTRVHHPQSIGRVERYHRTFREEGWGGAQPPNYPAAQALIAGWVATYNHTRLHSAFECLTPAEYYRGNPEARLAERRTKLLAARHRRRAAWEASHGAARSAGE